MTNEVIEHKILSKEEFEALPKWQQRVMIAQDVIEQIKIGRYSPRTGRYVSLDIPVGEYSSDIKENFEKIKDCSVCAYGACIMSAIHFKNTLKFYQVSHSDIANEDSAANEFIGELFSKSQLYLIEQAFEGSYVGSTVSGVRLGVVGRFLMFLSTLEYRANKFGVDMSSENRLIKIMENIIAHRGRFVP